MITDEAVSKIFAAFDNLPTRFKPRHLSDGRREWVPMAGIVIKDAGHDAASTRMHCVSLATGMKCLPRDKIPMARGYVLHDWHAEILAIRAFNRWILDECKLLVAGQESAWLERYNLASNDPSKTPDSHSCSTSSIPKPFALRSDTEVLMYISAAPCGDASMELTMASQQDATPWTSPAPSAKPGDMIGRGHFDQLGVVRRKPSRPDAPSTWSKSCSDKLAMKQCTGLLSGLVSRLVQPIYIQTLILPEDQIVPAAMERAFGSNGRMHKLAGQGKASPWQLDGYTFKPFEIVGTTTDFAFSKQVGCPSSNLACMWTPTRQEALVNGVLMGRKQFDSRGASSVSRRVMAEDVATLLAMTINDGKRVHDQSYEAFKDSIDDGRQAVKHEVKRLALECWRKNDGDEDWTVFGTPHISRPAQIVDAPIDLD